MNLKEAITKVQGIARARCIRHRLEALGNRQDGLGAALPEHTCHDDLRAFQEAMQAALDKVGRCHCGTHPPSGDCVFCLVRAEIQALTEVTQ